jgi:CheY-like chemotaxis protein
MPEPASARRVLVLEDSDEDFDTAEEALGRAKLSTTLQRATTGDVCLALLQGARARPAFVLLDLSTPGVDGREALREIRADRRLFSLPVVVLSSSASPREVEACYRAGASAYHVKPTRYAEHRELLVTIFQYWLGHVVTPEGTAAP